MPATTATPPATKVTVVIGPTTLPVSAADLPAGLQVDAPQLRVVDRLLVNQHAGHHPAGSEGSDADPADDPRPARGRDGRNGRAGRRLIEVDLEQAIPISLDDEERARDGDPRARDPQEMLARIERRGSTVEPIEPPLAVELDEDLGEILSATPDAEHERRLSRVDLLEPFAAVVPNEIRARDVGAHRPGFARLRELAGSPLGLDRVVGARARGLHVLGSPRPWKRRAKSRSPPRPRAGRSENAASAAELSPRGRP